MSAARPAMRPWKETRRSDISHSPFDDGLIKG
jgi:hypothetical protein